MRNKGFTIVELLVILAVISVMGVVLVDVFLRSLRGADKAQILALIQQNGQVSLDNMERSIRNSDAAVCPQTTPAAILMVVKDGKYTRFRFFTPPGNENSRIQIDHPEPSPDIFTDPTNADWINYCEGRDANALIPSNWIDLTDINAVSVTDGTFAKNKSPGFKDIITISFKISPSVKSINQKLVDPVTFQTTVEVR